MGRKLTSEAHQQRALSINVNQTAHADALLLAQLGVTYLLQ